MGRVKDYMMIDEERGFVLPPNKMVCADMFPHQTYIRERIEREGNVGTCSYSEKHDKVLPLSTIVEMVVTEFNNIYEDPANELPFESGGDSDDWKGSGLHKVGGGYILPEGKSIMTTAEALKDVGFMPVEEKIFDDIAHCFLTNDWVVKNALVGTDDERLANNWKQFWDSTISDSKKHVRYNVIYNSHARLLTYLSDIIARYLHSLAVSLSKNSLLYRCVNYKEVRNPLLASDLWAPPVAYATSQRMSREGQSRFYASFDKETPVNEAVTTGGNQYHCLGTFKLKKEVKLLDFTNIPNPYILNVPDYFAYRFLYDFQKAITQPVDDGKESKHKYVPTQIMRDLIEKDFSRLGIMGIKYHSVKHAGRHNVVMFLDNNTCGEWLELVDNEIINETNLKN